MLCKINNYSKNIFLKIKLSLKMKMITLEVMIVLRTQIFRNFNNIYNKRKNNNDYIYFYIKFLYL